MSDFYNVRLQFFRPLTASDNIPAVGRLNRGGYLVYLILKILAGGKQQNLMVPFAGIGQSVQLSQYGILILSQPQHIFVAAVHMVACGFDHSLKALRVRQVQLLLGRFIGRGHGSVSPQEDNSLGHIVHGIVQRSDQSRFIGLGDVFLGL